MAPQLYLTMYKEQFASPGRVKREQLRPTSAHRRNNPQPRPDFLVPWSLQSNHRSCRPLPPSSSSVNTDRPLFPPIRHLSFHSPVSTCPNNPLNSADKQTLIPPVNPSTGPALPSADRLQKLQLPPPVSGCKLHPARMGYQSNNHPLTAQQLRHYAGAQCRTRPQSSNPQLHLPRNQNLDHSGYSCFHVVKPYQAGHYIIHPEFVSECLH